MGKTTTEDFNNYLGHIKGGLGEMVSFYRMYPDYFVDSLRTEVTRFRLTPFQRVYLRAFFRNKKVGIVASRGISKTYVNVFAHLLKCVLYPNNALCLTMPTKEQSARVATEKIEEILKDYPLLRGEVKSISKQKDYVAVEFKNGSKLDTLTAGQSSRGLRANGLSLEEIVDERMTRETINEVLLPILAQPRQVAHFGADRENEYSKTEAYVTTASNKQSYCFEKFETLFDSMAGGEPTIVLGTGYQMGTRFGTLDEEDVLAKLDDKTYSQLSFDREYNSIFTGTSEKSYISDDEIRRVRVLEQSEDYASKADKESKSIHYFLAYDVARIEGKTNAQSSLVVLKCIDRGDGTFEKNIVNIYTIKGTHFRDQAIFLKQKVEDFGAEMLVVDVNGMGVGLVDDLVLEFNEHPPYSITNSSNWDEYRKPNSIPMVFALNSAQRETKEELIVNNFMAVFNNNDVNLLKSESHAKSFIEEKDGAKMANKLLPFIQTDRLVDEIMNLKYVNSGNKGRVERISQSIQKDRYSSIAYGLFYVYMVERGNKNMLNRKKSSTRGALSIKKANFRVFD